MSAFWMVLSRWAMTNEVLERKSNFRLCWIACSLSLSRLLVAYCSRHGSLQIPRYAIDTVRCLRRVGYHDRA